MKRQLYEIWKEFEGSRPVWKVQFPKGRLTFNTKKEATRLVKEIYKVQQIKNCY